MTAIRCGGVGKHFGSFIALRGVTFEVKERTCVGFLGPNGAGKTTTIKILAGLARPSQGQVEVAGVNVANSPEKVRRYIGYLPQSPAFYNWMSGVEYLQFCAGLFRLPHREASQRSGELLERVGLKDAAKRRIGGYSGASNLFYGQTTDPVWQPIAFTALLIIALLVGAWLSLRSQEL